MPKSKLFKRNAPKKTSGAKGPGLYMPRMSGGFRAPAPKPPSTTKPNNTLETKARTAATVAVAAISTGQTFLLDAVEQGTGANQRLGQKWQTTGIHLRGTLHLQGSTTSDAAGYCLVWDKSPNEIMPAPQDIMNDSGTSCRLHSQTWITKTGLSSYPASSTCL